MSQFSLFSCGLELANLMVTSDLLHSSWAAILNLCRDTNPNEQPSLPYSVKVKVYPQQPHNYTIIAFVTSPTGGKHHLQEGGDLVSSATFKETFPLFEFLCTKNNPSFSIHRAAITLFASLHGKLSLLKNQFDNSTSLIIAGHSLAGSIASLFTLWLLESIDPSTTKRPLCITFGSPFIGDNGLRQAILQRPTWNSCFLHVASNQDPVPRFILPHNPHVVDSSSQTIVYKPFGTFLLCSELGCTSFEDPESILELLVAMHSESARSRDPNEALQVVDYGYILEHLKRRVLFKGISELGEQITHPLRAGIVLQLEAIGVTRTQHQQQQHIENNTLIAKLEKEEVRQKRKDFGPATKLNKIKINMANLEWYKKSSGAQGIGYYDSYKNLRSKSDIEVVRYKKILTNYWKDMVAEVERRPQKERDFFETWLYAGRNYRRMVEPLDIADYYREKGLKDYLTQGRSEHYILLEQWLEDEERRSTQHNANKLNIACSLTEDSCFWANVEEAIISCKLLKSGDSSPEEEESSRESLIRFECYVMDLIRNYAVSPEIFLEQSSFMQWWREYNEIIETSYNSPLIGFMKNNNYRQYA